MAAEEHISEERREDPLLGILVGGRYRVLDVIGEGGMGRVYEALHEGLGRPVAIKVLGAAWASDEHAIQRFHREARTASNIGHRAIVDVSDLGRLDDGRPYLVMERLQGESFADLLDRFGRLPPFRVAHLIAEVASALDAVHARGIVHRDIKPENLVAIPSPDDGELVKLLDFGLAAFALPSAEAARLTRHGQMHGTPHYMAPESGEEALPDYRADVYSLAVVAYELLTGFVPFDSKNPLQILTRKMHEPPPTMRDRSGLQLSDDLERVMARGLATHPDDRYASAGELARDLRAAIDALPENLIRVSGTHPKLPERGEHETQEQESPFLLTTRSSHPPAPEALRASPASMRLDRRRLAMIGALALGALLLLWGGVASLQGGEDPAQKAPGATASPPPATSGPAPELTTADPARDPAAPEAPAADGPEPATVPAAPGTPGTAAASASEREAPSSGDAAEESAKAAPEDPLRTRQRARTATALRKARREQRDPAGRASQPSAAQGSRGTEPPPSLVASDRETSRALSRRGTSMLVQGRLPEAIRHFRDATLAHPGNAAAWRGLGLANERLGRKPEAARAYGRYLRIAPNAGDADSVRRRLDALQ